MAEMIQYWDKMLPNQTEHSNMYAGNDLMRDLHASITSSCNIKDPKEEFDLEESHLFSIEQMASNPIAMQFLKFLIEVAQVKTILEIGTFVGFSAMSFASAVPKDGKVYTIEKFDHFADIAERNFKKNKLDNKIELIRGDAFKQLDKLPPNILFDLIFIDGDKERYEDYFKATTKSLSPNGIVIVDDCFFHGDVLNSPPSSAKGKGTKSFLETAAELDDWNRIALPLSNGMYILKRNL